MPVDNDKGLTELLTVLADDELIAVMEHAMRDDADDQPDEHQRMIIVDVDHSPATCGSANSLEAEQGTKGVTTSAVANPAKQLWRVTPGGAMLPDLSYHGEVE